MLDNPQKTLKEFEDDDLIDEINHRRTIEVESSTPDDDETIAEELFNPLCELLEDFARGFVIGFCVVFTLSIIVAVVL